ncbi:hypothetical protein AB0N09_28035 [Streptomyces erythrochromogenes]|uniref:hypothetical protein n=1 Tax=Streptomyces erythrochromogenes TaxID=285574 RepID=UPI00342FB7BD
MNIQGRRIRLTIDIKSLGSKAYVGDEGVVTGTHADGYFTVRMDNGRPHFPALGEITVLGSPSR